MANLLFNIAKVFHVPLLLASYAIFAGAFAVGVVYLWQERQMKSKRPKDLAFQLPSLESLDRLISKLIGVAFPFLTVGILLGGCGHSGPGAGSGMGSQRNLGLDHLGGLRHLFADPSGSRLARP